jgi:hypothetical protein
MTDTFSLCSLEPSSGEVVVTLERAADFWRLEYQLYGLLESTAPVLSPAARKWPRQATRVDGLWRTSCCELFLAQPDTPAYLEFNFSPTGDWAAYAFESPREGRRAHVWEGAAPHICCAQRAWDRSSSIAPTGPAPTLLSSPPLVRSRVLITVQVSLPIQAVRGYETGLMGLSVIAHRGAHTDAHPRDDTGEGVTHWALRHSGPQADFHRRADYLNLAGTDLVGADFAGADLAGANSV